MSSQEFIKEAYQRRRHERIELLEEEMKLYSSQPEFQVSMMGLARLYVTQIRSPLAQTFYYHSTLVDAELQLSGQLQSENERPTPDKAFLSGETLALHVETKPLDRLQRQYFLKQQIHLGINDEDPRPAQAQVAAVFLDALDDPIEKVYDYFSPDMAQPIIDAATRYDGSSDGEQRDRFAAGYTHATKAIVSLSLGKLFFPRSL